MQNKEKLVPQRIKSNIVTGVRVHGLQFSALYINFGLFVIPLIFEMLLKSL